MSTFHDLYDTCDACGLPVSDSPFDFGSCQCHRDEPDELEELCSWFVLCAEPAVARAKHPAFPAGVPVCETCVSRFELELVEGSVSHA